MKMATLMAVLLLAVLAPAQSTSKSGDWRPATQAELKAVIPARAPVEKERIETEMRTASGVRGPEGKIIAGVVLITAGYSAEGKYSHFFIAQVPITVGEVALKPGEYVFGYRRDGESDSLKITFYEAETGKELGIAEAKRASRAGAVTSFRLSPKGSGGTLELGRFVVPYTVNQ
jgi:hypothetical protein